MELIPATETTNGEKFTNSKAGKTKIVGKGCRESRYDSRVAGKRRRWWADWPNAATFSSVLSPPNVGSLKPLRSLGQPHYSLDLDQ